MRRLVVFALGALIPLAVVPAAAVSTADGAASASSNGRIAFVQTNADHRSIWFVDLRGRGPRLVTPDPYDDARATLSRDRTRLYFQSDRGGGLDIWSAEPDGTSAINLTLSDGDDYQPDPSPDGRRVVFVSERSGNADLWLMNATGGSAEHLTRTREKETMPAWSPDGRSIAFTRWRDADHSQIVVRSLATGRERPVTDGKLAVWAVRWSPDSRRLAYTASVIRGDKEVSSRVVVFALRSAKRRTLAPIGGKDINHCDLNMYPDWSPTGRRLVLWATQGSGYGLWTIGPDGRNPKRVATDIMLSDFESVRWTRSGFIFAVYNDVPTSLIETIDLDGEHRFAVTNGLEEDSQPAWSPDGQTLAFSRFLGEGHGMMEIFLVRPDGSASRNLTRSEIDEQQPVWSPDGTRLAFAGDAGETNLVDIFTMRTDGTERRNLTHMPWNDAEPDWATNDRIVWARFPPATSDEILPGDIWSMRADGSDAHALLTGAANDEEPRVSPDGSTIVFVSQRDGRFQLYLMNADGSDARRLLTSDANDLEPDWSPDGRFIVFSRVTAETASIWVVGADGSGLRKVTDVCLSADAIDGELLTPVSPTWQPVVR